MNNRSIFRALEPQTAEEFVCMLLWDDFPECCGSPCVGAEYMGQKEMVCCGRPEPSRLSDAQIVASLRERFPEPSPSEATLVCYEAYAAIGTILADLAERGHPQAEKLLDNLCEARLVHKDVLPFADAATAAPSSDDGLVQTASEPKENGNG